MKLLKSIVVMVAILMLLVNAASGIEKKKKEPTAAKDTTKLVAPKSIQSAPKAPAKQAEEGALHFNDFIDHNKNGIDDRLEKGKPVETSKQVKPAEPIVKKSEPSKKTEVTKNTPAKDTASKTTKKKA